MSERYSFRSNGMKSESGRTCSCGSRKGHGFDVAFFLQAVPVATCTRTVLNLLSLYLSFFLSLSGMAASGCQGESWLSYI
jgi:hypothetical protein